MSTRRLTEGTDLLALEAGAGRLERPPRLSGRLRRRGTLNGDRWTVSVRFARHDGVLRLVSDEPVSFDPGERCRLDGEPLRLLAALDALDPSSRRRVARLLVDAPPNAPADLSQRIVSSFTAARRTRNEASPAARALLVDVRRYEREQPGELHVQSLASSGRAPIMRELVERGDVFELDGGYLVDRETYEARARALPASLTSRDAARRWGCSHGRARAILRRMAIDGRVRRSGSAYVRLEAHDA